MLNSVPLFRYSSSINMSTALISQFGNMSVIHEPESDELHVLSASVIAILDLMANKKNSRAEVLGLISKHCFGSTVLDEVAEGGEEYFQHLIDQGIIKKTQ